MTQYFRTLKMNSCQVTPLTEGQNNWVTQTYYGVNIISKAPELSLRLISLFPITVSSLSL